MKNNIRLLNNSLKVIVFSCCLCTLINCKMYSSTNISSYSNSFICDSISVMDYETAYFDADSSMIVLLRNEAFKYYFEICEKPIYLNNDEYYPFICGSNKVDTVGFLRFESKRILYKVEISTSDQLFLDFNANIGDKWSFNEGVFADYNLIMDNVFENDRFAGEVYVYEFDFKGPKVSHGHYYKNLFVSDKFGFLKLSFTDGINCYTEIGKQILLSDK